MESKKYAIKSKYGAGEIVVGFNENAQVVSFYIKWDNEFLSLSEYSEFFEDDNVIVKCHPEIFGMVDTPEQSSMYDGKDYIQHVLYKPTNQLLGIDGYYSSYDGGEACNLFVGQYREVTRYEAHDMKTFNVIDEVEDEDDE